MLTATILHFLFSCFRFIFSTPFKCSIPIPIPSFFVGFCCLLFFYFIFAIYFVHLVTLNWGWRKWAIVCALCGMKWFYCHYYIIEFLYRGSCIMDHNKSLFQFQSHQFFFPSFSSSWRTGNESLIFYDFFSNHFVPFRSIRYLIVNNNRLAKVVICRKCFSNDIIPELDIGAIHLVVYQCLQVA